MLTSCWQKQSLLSYSVTCPPLNSNITSRYKNLAQIVVYQTISKKTIVFVSKKYKRYNFFLKIAFLYIVIYLQHPYLRLLVSYIVIFCNFLVFAEDPVSHSKMEADIPVVGNVFSFVGTKYPPDWRWRLLKVKISTLIQRISRQ